MTSPFGWKRFCGSATPKLGGGGILAILPHVLDSAHAVFVGLVVSCKCILARNVHCAECTQHHIVSQD